MERELRKLLEGQGRKRNQNRSPEAQFGRVVWKLDVEERFGKINSEELRAGLRAKGRTGDRESKVAGAAPRPRVTADLRPGASDSAGRVTRSLDSSACYPPCSSLSRSPFSLLRLPHACGIDADRGNNNTPENYPRTAKFAFPFTFTVHLQSTDQLSARGEVQNDPYMTSKLTPGSDLQAEPEKYWFRGQPQAKKVHRN